MLPFFRRSRSALHASVVGAFLALAAASAGAARPHVHGAAELHVSIEGPRLEIHLETPLENLVGFEHAPRTDKQREAVRAMAARLRDAGQLFTPTADAACKPESVRLASPVLPPQLLGEQGPQPRAGQGDGHADLEATFVFRCTSPERLQGLDTGLLKAFPGLRKVKVQVATSRGQAASVLSPGRTTVRW